MRIPLRSIATVLMAVGVATCSDSPAGSPPHTVSTPQIGARARISLSPVFSSAALATYARLVDAGINFDRVRVVIIRPVADTVADTTITFLPGQPDQTLDLNVTVDTPNEVFSGAIDYANANGVLFHGVIDNVQSYTAGQPTPPQQPVVVQYVGPGANVARIAITPKTTTVVAPNSATFSAAAFDASNAPVATVPLNWTTSDATVATISNVGVLQPTGKRGTVTITASTPTNISDNATATVTLPASGITLVSGGGQTGKAGATLSAAGVVRVFAVDGGGVSGVPVNFAAPIAGSVGASTVVTDATGQASTSLTLGSAVGAQGFAAAYGAFNVAISETATAGDPASLVAVSGSGQADTLRKTLANPFVVRVIDRFSNPVPNVVVSWSRAGTGSFSAATSTTNATGLATIGYTLGTTAGLETITATVGALTVNFTAQALPSTPTGIIAVSGDGQTGRVLQALPLPLVVSVTDASAAPVVGAFVNWAATNGTFPVATTTTDATGHASNVLTLGGAVGPASVTASLSTGQSVAFAATVQSGTVARIAFRTNAPNGGTNVALTPAIQVELQDAAGNRTAAANAVSIALGANPGSATLTGTLSRAAVGGVATFDDLKLDRTGTGYTLVVSSVGVASITSASFNITQGVPNHFQIAAGDAQQVRVGTAAPILPSVIVLDVNNAPVPNIPVTFTPATGSGTVAPTGAITTNAQGSATVTSWTLGTTSGTQSLVVSSPGMTNAVIHATVTPGPSLRLGFITPPPTAATRGSLLSPQPVVQIQDQYGNATFASGVQVTASVSSGSLIGTPTLATDANGLATYADLAIDTPPGTATLTFAAGTLAPITSPAITISASAPVGGLVVPTPLAPTVQNNVVLTPAPRLQIVDGTPQHNPIAAAGIVVRATIVAAGSLSGNVRPAAPGAATTTVRPPVRRPPGPANPLFVPPYDDSWMMHRFVLPTLLQGTSTTVTAVTDVNGIATFTGIRAVGTTGSFALMFSVDQTEVSIVTNDIQLVAGPAYDIVLGGGNLQVGLIGAALPIGARVQLVDTTGNTVTSPSTTVSFAVQSGGGSVTPSVVTDGAGEATAIWTLGPTEGTNTIVAAATINGINRTVTFAATGSDVHALTIVTPLATAMVERTVFSPQPTIQLTDGHGNALRKQGVSIAAGIAHDASGVNDQAPPPPPLAGAVTATTDALGIAHFTTLQDGGTQPQTVHLSFTDQGNANVPVLDSPPIVVSIGPPANIVAISNTSLVGHVGQPFTYPSLRVTDAQTNPVPGTSVNLALSGPCTLNVSSLPTDANGAISLTGHVTVPANSAGSCQVTASAAGLTGSPLAFDLIVAPVGYTAWTGASTAQWENAANFEGNVAPSATSKIFVPRWSANAPTLAANSSINSLTVDSTLSMTLSGHTLTLAGNLDAGPESGNGGINNGAVALVGTGAQTLRGALPSISIGATACGGGSFTLTDFTAVAGDVTINCPLDINGEFLFANPGITGHGDITITGPAGLVNLTNPGGMLTPTLSGRNITFGGASESGFLTTGAIALTGNLTQLSTFSPTSFVVSTVNLAVAFEGSGLQTVSFASPQSQFGLLQVGSQTTFASNVTALFYITTNGANATFNGSATINGQALLNGGQTNFSTSGTNLITGSLSMTNSSISANSGTLTVNGGVTADAASTLTHTTLISTSGTFPVFSNTTPLSGPDMMILTNVFVPLSNDATVSGALQVQGGALDLNGHHLTVNGDFSTTSSGTLKMTSAASALTVSGDASFTGGSESNALTNGTFLLAGNFNQGGPTIDSFVASSALVMTFNGTSATVPQDVTMVSGTGTSHLGSGVITNSGAGVRFLTASYMFGNLDVLNGATMTIGANGALTMESPAMLIAHANSFEIFNGTLSGRCERDGTSHFSGSNAPNFSTCPADLSGIP